MRIRLTCARSALAKTVTSRSTIRRSRISMIPAWVKLVKLDERSRRQQVGEGHFRGLDEVPTHAMTLTIPALLAARRVLAIVPEARKADAVFAALRGPISEDCPGSILRQTPHAHLFLDLDSARQVYP